MANAKVEVGVQIVQRWIVARLRNRRFFSLRELNEAIRELTERLNDRVTRHLGSSRRKLFEEIERAALKPLPATPYEFCEWRQRTVGIDYHVDIDRHYYSVPHSLLKEKVWARITERTFVSATQAHQKKVKNAGSSQTNKPAARQHLIAATITISEPVR